ncbi:MAG: immunity 26/phosphotriesterase HocA family protein [Acidobacteria bacterium]|nr:immunity 26/phosphotriesterase HocA family protein [Acidobacteriota bacterium]MCA1620645.1 immunity 26/phosphotriesterase HocA family protein [Acidobacteriota bacterium]
MGNELKERHLAELAAALREIAEDFADEINRRPTLAELFEILTEGVRAVADDTLADVSTSNVLALRPVARGGAATTGAGGEGSAVPALNDNVFSLAADLMAEAARLFKADTGRPPTLEQLCRALAEALRRCPDDLLADAKPGDIEGVKAEAEGAPKRAGKKRSSSVGDVVAIPAKNGEYFPALVVAKNIFGTAYGLFEGTAPLDAVSTDRPLRAKPNPIYSGNRFVGKGRWKIVGHDEAALSRFPSEPELYHEPRGLPAFLNTGPHGAAQHPAGKFRSLSREEAEENGIGRGGFKGVYQDDELEEFLNAQLDE